MKGKLKKLIAGAAALAMAAQFAFVLPASADGEYYGPIDFTSATTDSLNAEWVGQTGKGSGGTQRLTVATDASAPDLGNFMKYTTDGKDGGHRCINLKLPETAGNVDENKEVVVEFDMNMTMSGTRTSQIGFMGAAAAGHNALKSGKCAEPYLGQDFALLFSQATDGSIFVNNSEVAGDTANGGDIASATINKKWAHVKAVLNYETKEAFITINDLSGTNLYKGNALLGTGDSKIAYLYIACTRNGGGWVGLDNVVIRPRNEETDPIERYYIVTYSIDGKETTESVKEGEKPAKFPDPDPKKLGYLFKGWTVDDGTERQDSATLKEQAINANVKYTAVFEPDPDYIEELASVKINTPSDGLLTMGTSAEDFCNNEITLTLQGEIGGDIFKNPDSRVNDFDIQWQFDGFRTMFMSDGTSKPTDSDTEETYCDSYARIEYDNTTPTDKAVFKLANQASNYYGRVKVKVTYHGKEFEVEKPLAILANTTQPEGQLLPKPGYVQDITGYEDSMVGYKAVISGDNRSASDVATGDWAAYGGNSDRSLVIAAEGEGDAATKYFAYEAKGTNSSSFAVNHIGTAPTGQVVIEQDMRFYNNADILYKQANPVTWNDNAVAVTMSFDGTSLKLNGGTAIPATTGKWYHIVITADVTSKKCYAVVSGGDLAEPVKTAVRDFTNAGATAPVYLCYRTPDNSAGKLDFKNVKVYVPKVSDAGLITTASKDLIMVPSGETVETDGITYDNGTVTVTKSDAADGDKATLIHAVYDGSSLVSAKPYDLTFASKKATQTVTGNTGKFMLWNNLDDMQPVLEPAEVLNGLSGDNTVILKVNAETTDGYDMIGEAMWSVVDNPEDITIVPGTDTHTAALVAGENAQPGTVTVRVALGGTTKDIEMTVKGTKDSLGFTRLARSISIPYAGEDNAAAEFAAQVVDKDGTPVAGKDVTYSLYDSENENALETETMPAGITFDAAAGKITVSSEANPTVVYLHASSTNSAGEPLERAIKVTVYGLKFDFGNDTTAATAAGYTAVTNITAYSETQGYGISAGTPTLAGEDSNTDASKDSAKGDFTFKVNVPKGKVYDITVKGSGNVVCEYVNSDLTGIMVTAPANGVGKYAIACIDGVLDLRFTGGDIQSIEIAPQADKEKGDKPHIYTIGDSTIANNGSWAYRLNANISSYPALSALASFSCNGRGGRNLSSFYSDTTGNYLNGILTAIKPGDYVTIGNMGTNGQGNDFEGSFNYYVDACEAMGAKVILNSYTPHGAVSEYAGGYNPLTYTFDSYRRDGYDAIVRAIYAERSDESNAKYDSQVVGFVDIGKMADAAFNAYVRDYDINGYETATAAADAIIKCFSDHNHYSNDTIACDLMLNGYGDDAKGIVKTLVEIITADLAAAE